MLAIFVSLRKKFPTGEVFRCIDIDAIANKRHRITELKTVPTSKAPSRAAKGVVYGDTLFSMARPYLDSIAFIPEDMNNLDVFVLSPTSDGRRSFSSFTRANGKT
jgi:hypothetical protein